MRHRERSTVTAGKTQEHERLKPRSNYRKTLLLEGRLCAGRHILPLRHSWYQALGLDRHLRVSARILNAVQTRSCELRICTAARLHPASATPAATAGRPRKSRIGWHELLALPTPHTPGGSSAAPPTPGGLSLQPRSLRALQSALHQSQRNSQRRGTDARRGVLPPAARLASAPRAPPGLPHTFPEAPRVTHALLVNI